MSHNVPSAPGSAGRDHQVLNIFTLENTLFDRIAVGDTDGLDRILSQLAASVEETNRAFMPGDEDLLNSTRLYFSYLWRRIARVIYERTGRRKTITRGVTMDLEMQELTTRDEVISLVMGYITELTRELDLTAPRPVHKVIDQVKRYIAEHYADDVSLESAAQAVGLSDCYLSKLFKKEEGLNFKNYVIQIRMEKAMELIREGKLNVNEIAAAVGYENANYFSQTFHKYYGLTPNACRTRGMQG